MLLIDYIGFAHRLKRPEKYDGVVIRAEDLNFLIFRFAPRRIDADDIVVHVTKYTDGMRRSFARAAHCHVTYGAIETRRLAMVWAWHEEMRLDDILEIPDILKIRDQFHFRFSKKNLAQLEMKCAECPADKICNPATGRCVLKRGKLGKSILASKNVVKNKNAKTKAKATCPPCSADKICNDTTARCVLKTGAIGTKILASMKTQPRANRIAPLVNIPTVARAAAVPMPNINAPQNYGPLLKPLERNLYERYGSIIAKVNKNAKVNGPFYIAPNAERAALWNANIPSNVPAHLHSPKIYMRAIFGPLEQFPRPQSGTYGAVYKVPVTDARMDVLNNLVQRLTSRVVHAMPLPGDVIAIKIGTPLAANPDIEDFQELVQDGVHEARVHRAVVRGQWMGMKGASIVPPFYFSGYDPEYGVFVHVTRFFAGQTLFHRLNQRSLTAQIAARVEAVILLFWCLGFVHADLHTGNIMVHDDGSVCLIDFGRTQPITPDLTARTRAVVLSALQGIRLGNAWPASTIMEAWRALSEFTNSRANWNLWNPNGRALVAILRRATDDGASRNLPAARRLAWKQLGFAF